MSKTTGRYAFTEEEQDTIREEYRSSRKVTYKTLAEKNGCSPDTARNVVNRVGPYSEEHKTDHRERNQRKQAYLEKIQKKARKLRAEGLTLKVIATRLGLSQSSVSRYL